ncbi:MAG: winged helix-turn-helix transcriptional regulator [Candidatus Omnitrophica bacterium]|nr:winged helix-turn-helix transcriptional regulator [Candidatus Omnitrophota bacterium]
MGNYEKGKFFLNNACILMFSKEPQNFFRQNFISCILYKGKDKNKILDRKDFYDDLLSLYYNALTFIKSHLNLEYIIENAGPRKEIYEIPEESFREALLNAIIHGDYYDDRFGIFVEIFDNKVQITNKGPLLFDKKYFGKISLPRNPLLFDLFYRLGLIEKVGSGIIRIQNACRNKKIRVVFDTGNFFIVTFYRKETTQETTQKTTQKNLLTDLERKIIDTISINNKFSQKQISQRLKISINTVKEYIKKLKQKKILIRIDPDKGGYWKINL